MDSFLADLGDLIRTHQGWAFPIVTLISLGAVSYTHLTLPTICSV